MRRRPWHVLLVAVAVALGAGCGVADPGPAGEADPPAAGEGAGLPATVVRVIDGDTIRVEARGFETPVRLLGIDAPETRHPDVGEECFGAEATARLKRLLPEGARVRLETDPSQDARDRYGRLLAYVYPAGRDGPAGSVNHDLVRTGHATVYVFRDPFLRLDAFRAAQAEARRAGRGLWGPPCFGATRGARREAAVGAALEGAGRAGTSRHRKPRRFAIAREPGLYAGRRRVVCLSLARPGRYVL